MNKSKEFMLLFRFQPDFNDQPSEADMAAEHQQWGAFIGNLAIQEKLVSTYQLGFEGKQINSNQDVTEGIYISESATLGGSLTVKANSLEEAVEIGKGCPILAAAGGTVEVREIIPMN